MVRPIVKLGHPALRAPNKPIPEITQEVTDLAVDLIETLNSSTGIGLAAPQIGVNVQMAAIRILSCPLLVINPTLELSDKFHQSAEGCLSIPHIRVSIPRARSCHMNFLDLNGNAGSWPLDEMTAIVAQHEIDHLNGVLMIDRLDDRQKALFELAGGEQKLIETLANGHISYLQIAASLPLFPKVGRNTPCPCGSGKKFKMCCL